MKVNQMTEHMSNTVIFICNEIFISSINSVKPYILLFTTLTKMVHCSDHMIVFGLVRIHVISSELFRVLLPHQYIMIDKCF